jgi:hypothetical protein
VIDAPVPSNVPEPLRVTGLPKRTGLGVAVNEAHGRAGWPPASVVMSTGVAGCTPISDIAL